MTCPRCAGTILPDANGDRACLQCGYEYISLAQRAATQRELARQAELRKTRTNIRPASSHQFQL